MIGRGGIEIRDKRLEKSKSKSRRKKGNKRDIKRQDKKRKGWRGEKGRVSRGEESRCKGKC